jgi:hypothetical protein
MRTKTGNEKHLISCPKFSYIVFSEYFYITINPFKYESCLDSKLLRVSKEDVCGTIFQRRPRRKGSVNERHFVYDLRSRVRVGGMNILVSVNVSIVVELSDLSESK